MGEEMDYCKINYFKLAANKDFFQYERVNKVTGEIRIALRSSRDLTKLEMTLCINRFKEYSAKLGIILPNAEDKAFITEAMQEVEHNKQWL